MRGQLNGLKSLIDAVPAGPQGPVDPEELQGPAGNDVATDAQRPQGPPGEVTNSQPSSTISGTSNNTNGVATLDTPFADPDVEALRQRFNELVLALRR